MAKPPKLIKVSITPRSREQRVQLSRNLYGDRIYNVWVKALPKDGEANKELVEVLAKHFGVPKSFITLKIGEKAKYKILSIHSN